MDATVMMETLVGRRALSSSLARGAGRRLLRGVLCDTNVTELLALVGESLLQLGDVLLSLELLLEVAKASLGLVGLDLHHHAALHHIQQLVRGATHALGADLQLRSIGAEVVGLGLRRGHQTGSSTTNLAGGSNDVLQTNAGLFKKKLHGPRRLRLAHTFFCTESLE